MGRSRTKRGQNVGTETKHALRCERVVRLAVERQPALTDRVLLGARVARPRALEVEQVPSPHHGITPRATDTRVRSAP